MSPATRSKVVANRGLALVQQFAQGAHVQFFTLRQVVQDSQSRFIGKQLEQLDQVDDQIFGNFQVLGCGRVELGVACVSVGSILSKNLPHGSPREMSVSERRNPSPASSPKWNWVKLQHLPEPEPRNDR
jgi:hypothetical protein